MSDDERDLDEFIGDGDGGGGDDGGGDDGGYHFEPQDEDAAEMERAVRSAKDGLVLAIDCRANMFKKYPDSGKTPFSLAMGIASTILRRKIITSSRSQVAILLWGAKHSLNKNNFDHLYTLFSLDTPSAGMISQLETFADFGETGRKLFETKIGSQDKATSGGATLENMFWLLTFLFDEAKFTQSDTQRVWVFTNDEDPCRDAPELRQRTIVRAKDLEKVGRTVTLWTMSRKNDRGFDASKFWGDILQKPPSQGSDAFDDDDEDPDNILYVTSESDLKQIIQSNRKKEFAKRTLVSVPFILGPNVEIGVKMYAIVLETKIPNPVQLESSNARPLKVVTRWLCPTTTETLTPDQILYTARYGGVGRVPFNNEDKRRVKRFAPASLTLLGFKPLKDLEIWQNVRAPYLLRPDEKSVKGSNKAFVALLSAVIDQKLFAVGRLINNKSAAPKLVALVPQVEQVNEEDGEVVTPMGFIVVVLPYADDIRTPSFNEPFAEASADQVEKAKRLIRELTNNNEKPFDPRDYENPALQKYWTNLEAVALDKKDDQDAWKEAEDDTLRLPNEDELIFNESFANAAQAFTDSYGGPGEIEAKKPARKRTAAAAADDDEEGDGGRSKGKKSAKPAVDASTVDWQELKNEGKLESLTVADLKVYLKTHNLPQSGTKAVLIERISDHLEGNCF